MRSPWLRSADALLWLYVSSWYNQMARFNSSMDQILKDGEEYLEDMELAEANVQMAYRDYREQVHTLTGCVRVTRDVKRCGMVHFNLFCKGKQGCEEVRERGV